MEAHPVPQNISSFEFHLIGDMTLKQFTYLAAGLAIGYVMYVFFVTPFPLIAWPIIAVSVLSGAAFAFVPIQDRPLDHWMGAFLKAIFTPTQREYKSKTFPKNDPRFTNRLNTYLSQVAAMPPTVPITQTQLVPVNIQPNPQQLNRPALLPNMQLPTQQTAPEPEKKPEFSKEELRKTVDLAKEAQQIQSKIIITEQELNQIKSNAAIPDANPKVFATDFQKLLIGLQKLNQQASEVSYEIATVTRTPSQPTNIVKLENYQKTPGVIAPTLTTIPNIINGVITDIMGNYADGAIIVAHDKQGTPVRALKTNKLGQFIAATPLPNGTYMITVEKDELLFDAVQLETKGEILNPIVLSAKKANRPTPGGNV